MTNNKQGLLIRAYEGFKAAMFKPINPSAVGILGGFSILWGLWVSNPFWSTFDTALLFEVMRSVAPEQFWGIASIMVGATIFYGVAKGHYRPLVTGALTGFYFWLFVSVCFFMGDWQNTGGVTIGAIAIYCGYVALNVATNKEYFVEK